MSVITTNNVAKALRPGVKNWFGMFYETYPEEYKYLFDLEMSDKKYEEDVQVYGFGLAPVKSESAAVSYDTHQQGYVNRATHVTYGLGYILSEEEIEDNLYEKLAKQRTQALARSMKVTKETVCANIYNRAFSSSYVFGDGKELIATDHPTLSGNQANELSAAADLSEASLEDLVILIGSFKDDRGLQIQARPKSLIVPVNLEFEACRILKSQLQNDTGNNAINALMYTNKFPDGVVVNHYLTDTDAFFVRTDVAGSVLYQRRKLVIDQDNDFDTTNIKFKATERYVPTVYDWRSVAGSQGA